MGIYKNDGVEPKLFQAKENRISSNQEVFKFNYLHHILENQARINHSLQNSVTAVNERMEQTTNSQNKQLLKIVKKVEEQDQYSEQVQVLLQNQMETNEALMKRLMDLEQKSEELMKKFEADGLLTEAILEQQSSHDQTISKLMAYLEEQEPLGELLKKQEELYDELSKKLDLQEIFHRTVMERMDQQDGLLTKLKGELDHLRSVIYERASHLVDKFEHGFGRMSKPFQSFLVNKEQEKFRKYPKE